MTGTWTRFGSLIVLPVLAFGVRSTAATTPAASAGGATERIWEWTGLTTAAGTTAVPGPERYTLQLLPSGESKIRFDCNRGGGSYKLDGDRLSFGPLIATRRACPEDSLDARFTRYLGLAESLRIEGDVLTLGLRDDEGSMTFRAGGANPAASEMARLSIEAGSLSRALDQGAATALESSVEELELKLGRSLQSSEREQVREILRSALADIVTPDVWERTLADTYGSHFSEAEIRSALEFYRSPLGRKILEKDPEMAQEIEERIVNWFEKRLDGFAETVDAALARKFPAPGAAGSR